MALTITISYENIIEAIKSATIEEKKNIVEIIENELLSDWDAYDNSPEMKNKVNEALSEYKNGDVISLNELMQNEL